MGDNPYFGGDVPYRGDVNSWDGSGAQPNIGTKNTPSETPTSGFNNSPPTSTALNVAPTDDYTGWNWEEILNGVLGLALPSRNQVTDLRWTVTDSNMNEDHSLFKIFGAAWFTNGQKDFLVYLNPAIQDQGGPWDEFYNVPANKIANATSGPYFPGVLDPKDFASAAAAIQGVEGLYGNAGAAFGIIEMGLNSEASEFKGQAGQAFYQLIDNLNTYAQSIYTQMTPSVGGSYSDLISAAGQEVKTFVLGLWNALVNWSQQRLDWSPLGAIFQALLDGGIIVNGGNQNTAAEGGSGYSVSNALEDTPFGNLLNDDGWVQVEAAAKDLWNASVASSLDAVALPLVTALATAFLNATDTMQPLSPPTMQPITTTSANTPGLNVPAGLNGAAGLNTPSALTAGLNGSAGLNTPSALTSGLNGAAGLNTPSAVTAGLNTPSDLSATVGGDSGLNTPAVSLGSAGTGAAAAALNTPAAGLNDQGLNAASPLSADVANPNTVAAALGIPPAAASDLQTALGDSQAAGSQLQRALSLAPSSGPLHNTLESALAANGQQQKALQSALTGNTPVSTALGNALADNKAAQADLQRALAQAPPTGPLHDELASALADTRHTGTALHQALTSAGIPAELGHIDSSPTAGLGGLAPLLNGGQGMVASVGPQSPLAAGASGAAGVNGLSSGLAAGAAAAPGTLTSPAAAGAGSSGVPFFSPMAGGGMNGGAQGQPQERERTTWLAEDEDVWGTDPDVTPHVLGRDFADDDELDDYEDYAEPEPESRRAPDRARGR
jgi:hypothetical protein